jgi:PTS system mannose-specific IIB component
MISLVRVDDRLLHGQIICAWVPFVDADSLVVASDEAAGDELTREMMGSCEHPGLGVEVKTVDEAVVDLSGEGSKDGSVILIVADLKDALKIYEKGVRFKSLNIGNVHHDDHGRVISPSVILDAGDEAIIERFLEDGVSIDIRNVPASEPVTYSPR